MDEWIKWTTGECPVPPYTMVEIKTRTLGTCIGPANLFHWKINEYMQAHDIVAYRIVEEE